IRLTDNVAPRLVSTTLPAEGQSTSSLIAGFTLTFTEPLDPTTLTSSTGISLLGAGPDGVLGNGDDVTVALTLRSYDGGTTVGFDIAGGLGAGRYRLTLGTGLADRVGNHPVASTRTFDVVALPGYTSEAEPNNTSTLATPLTFVEGPPGLRIAAGRGSISSYLDTDYWSFAGTAGQEIEFATENPGDPSYTGLQYQITGPDGSYLGSYSSYEGRNEASFVLPATGTYLIRVSQYYTYTGEYRLRVLAVVPPVQLVVSGTPELLPDSTAKVLTATIAGAVTRTGQADSFALGAVDVGQQVQLTIARPAA
ncbi:Ig-like domain-containing protein, partial [Aquisphaera insulae]|uniref:Ig-like domain-containing protein n=1 Tax=Aquisphaera insulae TaxID=2712864 RepID=UPI00196B9791